ncbi:hypothetical protein PLICRDRAFT_179053 [Plicaturopsis crispa FD-325 SS-3]|uniref:Uncharacterized protein n=1 Tax=Plicaturopsis crispa FD-325 SS-3 TaxID=944288 RepID=A0A0C9SRJ1_PLICR|nr:hypothetical protein PLICRDRAFT_179053 [Plicaturopsis crispa FD-325 SS-3]
MPLLVFSISDLTHDDLAVSLPPHSHSTASAPQRPRAFAPAYGDDERDVTQKGAEGAEQRGTVPTHVNTRARPAPSAYPIPAPLPAPVAPAPAPVLVQRL